ncbi:MAG: SDR family oxidoreductase [Phenylobacterium sp.]|nr:SDR family oxidoreductase [Phenylobacterium sp.]
MAGAHALVTGGGRGIGAAVAAALREAGSRVTILGRDEPTLRAAVSAGWADGHVVCDLTDEAQTTAAFAAAEATRGDIDMLVNNAGAAASAPFHRTSAQNFRTMLDVNLMSCVHATQAALPGMIRRRRGRIVNIASTAGLKGYAYVTAYVAAKHAVVGLTRALALETARTGVTVNAVCPGFTDTELLGRSLDEIVAKTGRTRDAARADLAAANPQGRLVEPAEVAAAVLFLCGASAGAVNGVALTVAGGEI